MLIPTDYIATAADIANEAARMAMIAKRNRRTLESFERRSHWSRYA